MPATADVSLRRPKRIVSPKSRLNSHRTPKRQPILAYLSGELGQARLDRFWSHVYRRGPDECWPWTGGLTSDGYGSFKLASYVVVTASRMALIAERMEEPADLHVLHRCDNPICCNPGHLWFGTAADNAQDKVKKGRARGRFSVGAAGRTARKGGSHD